MGKIRISMVGFRTQCVLLVAVFACAVLGAPFEGNVELIQVQNLGTKDEIPANMDQMKAMINSAMQETEQKDLGEMNSAKSQQQDLQRTFDSISEDEAIADEMAAEASHDCVLTTWVKWSKCDKKCGGGETSRSRKIMSTAMNGGKACPMNDDGTPFVMDNASCNTESCAEDDAAHEAKLRHLTDDEVDKENVVNKKVFERAMRAPSVERMSQEMNLWIKKATKTSMVHVILPGEAPPTDEELVQEDLKKAIAKNSVQAAMQSFDKEEQGKEKTKETKKEEKPN